MKEIIKRWVQKTSPNCQEENGNNYAYALFRLIVSGMFFAHGASKLFGLFGGLSGHGDIVHFGSLLWYAGIIEFAVGLLVFLGVFTRLAALFGMAEMFVAYFMVHFPKGFNPLNNGGELALFYFVAFLIIFRYGAGKFSLKKVKTCPTKKQSA